MVCVSVSLQSRLSFQFVRAVVGLENDVLTVYEKDGNIYNPADEPIVDTEENDTRPKTNGYANEIEYFKNCVISDKQPDKVNPFELEAVIEILKSM